MNTELFKKIHAQIEAEPQSFDMENWETLCGATRCIAGHAISLATGQPLYGQDGSLHPSVISLAEFLGVDSDFSSVAAKLLGLSKSAATEVFIYMGDDRALEFVKLAAERREAEALRLLGY